MINDGPNNFMSKPTCYWVQPIFFSIFCMAICFSPKWGVSSGFVFLPRPMGAGPEV